MRSGAPGEVTCGGSPHLSCKRDQIKMRDYMERRVTSPTWGPPPPYKQALNLYITDFAYMQRLLFLVSVYLVYRPLSRGVHFVSRGLKSFVYARLATFSLRG